MPASPRGYAAADWIGEAWTATEAPDYFQPEGGLVLTHLLIVRRSAAR
ncbi:hypothetical protein OG799_11750 [Micromonospora sp. NBC_00898]|nr:hypothetical protein OG799_11750 [Micromonospora sp. NBC_00898]